jgi:hypothetical protein
MMTLGEALMSDSFFASVGAALGRPLGFLLSLGGLGPRPGLHPGVRSLPEPALAPEESFSSLPILGARTLGTLPHGANVVS